MSMHKLDVLARLGLCFAAQSTKRLLQGGYWDLCY